MHDLESALRLRPDDEELIEAIALLRLELATGPSYVAVEEATVLGRKSVEVVGRLFIVEDDGRLKPVNGVELRRFADRHPAFAQSWRLKNEWD